MAIQNFALGSTAIDQVWYDAENEVLWVKFRKVKDYPKYRFEPVPMSVVVGLINAGSAGSYYQSNIKGKYYTTTIDGPDNDRTRSMMFNLLRK